MFIMCAVVAPPAYMRCVQCGSLKDKVLDSRSSKDGTTIRRRRECMRCNYRYTTYEQIERTELRVIKRDGTREALNREKLMSGLIKACEKRPVPMDRLDRAVEEILTDLHKDHVNEVPSSIIGGKVMELVPAVEMVLAQDLATVEEREQIEKAVKDLRKALSEGVANPLKSAVQRLDLATEALAARLVEKAMEEALEREMSAD